MTPNAFIPSPHIVWTDLIFALYQPYIFLALALDRALYFDMTWLADLFKPRIVGSLSADMILCYEFTDHTYLKMYFHRSGM